MTSVSDLSKMMEELTKRMAELEVQSNPSSSGKQKTVFHPTDDVSEQIRSFASKTISPEKSSESEKSQSFTTRLPNFELPIFEGKNFQEFLKRLARFFRLTGLENAPEQLKKDYLVTMCKGDAQTIVEGLIENHGFVEVLEKMSTIWPKLDSDLTIRAQLDKMPGLPYLPEPSSVALLLHNLETLISKLSPGAMSEQEKLILLLKKIEPRMLKEMRADRVFRDASEDYDQLKSALVVKSSEDWTDKHLQLNRGKALMALDDQMEVDATQNVGKGRGKGKGKGQGKGKSQGKGNSPNPRYVRNNENNEKEFNQKFSANLNSLCCQKRGHFKADC